MKLKLFTLAYDNDRKVFDDGAMVAFLADKEALLRVPITLAPGLPEILALPERLIGAE